MLNLALGLLKCIFLFFHLECEVTNFSSKKKRKLHSCDSWVWADLILMLPEMLRFYFDKSCYA